MRIALVVFIGLLGLFSCKEETKSANPLAEYFYPFDDEPKVYLFREMAQGLDERFHRIYRIDDSFGKHMVIEVYSADARLIEAYNYNIDSLDLMDHMVVDGKRVNQKGELSKTNLFPWSKDKKGSFLSRFPGPIDSTLLVYNIDRRVLKNKAKTVDVIGSKTDVLVFEDNYILSLLNAKGETETEKKGKTISYYAKGYGMVRWHDDKKNVDYQLEKILTEPEWAKMVVNQ